MKPVERQKECQEIPSPQTPITVTCSHCGRLLFRGTRQQAKGLIIYCVDCPKAKG